MKRKYDIGHGVIVTDDGHTLRAERKVGENGTTSVGIKRPLLGVIPEDLDIQYSLGRGYFYLPLVTDGRGFWLGTKAWASKDEMQAQQMEGLWGKEGVELTNTQTGETYYREIMSFMGWSVKAERDQAKISRHDEMAKDYLSLAQMRDRESERKFNEEIAHSGRTLKWIMDRIGQWQPEPPEPPPTVLAD